MAKQGRDDHKYMNPLHIFFRYTCIMKKDPYRKIVYLNVLCDHPYVVSFTFCCSAIPTSLMLFITCLL